MYQKRGPPFIQLLQKRSEFSLTWSSPIEVRNFFLILQYLFIFFFHSHSLQFQIVYSFTIFLLDSDFHLTFFNTSIFVDVSLSRLNFYFFYLFFIFLIKNVNMLLKSVKILIIRHRRRIWLDELTMNLQRTKRSQRWDFLNFCNLFFFFWFGKTFISFELNRYWFDSRKIGNVCSSD